MQKMDVWVYMIVSDAEKKDKKKTRKGKEKGNIYKAKTSADTLPSPP